MTERVEYLEGKETLRYLTLFKDNIIEKQNGMNETLSSLERSYTKNITQLNDAQNELLLMYLKSSNVTFSLNQSISEKYHEITVTLNNLSQILNNIVNNSDNEVQNVKINKSRPTTAVINTDGKIYHTCLELLANGYHQSGTYNITPTPGHSKTVYCDQNFNGGGWIVIMRNKYGNITFDQTWDKYKNGFGFLHYDFWLGNEFLYQITTLYNVVRGKAMDLYIKLIGHANKMSYAKYSKFFVNSEVNKYYLRIGGYSGTAGDSLSYSNYKFFTTKDSDNDASYRNCATVSQNGGPATLGGWWYSLCYRACLTKTFNVYDTVRKSYLPAPQWYYLGYNYNYLKGAEMMIREKS